jgi:hypothetical protein
MQPSTGRISETGLAKALGRRPHLACCLRVLSKAFERTMEAEDGGFLNVAPASSTAAIDELRRELEAAEEEDEESVQTAARDAQDVLELAVLKQNRERRQAKAAWEKEAAGQADAAGKAAAAAHHAQHLTDLALRAGHKVTKRLGSFIDHALHHHTNYPGGGHPPGGAAAIEAEESSGAGRGQSVGRGGSGGRSGSRGRQSAVAGSDSSRGEHLTAAERLRVTASLAASTQQVIEVAEEAARKSLAGPLHVGHGPEVRA